MKKARTLLAIWLALILTLTLFPTALAVEGETTPTGDDEGNVQKTYTIDPREGIKLVSPTSEKTPIVFGDNTSTITFTVETGYQYPSANLLRPGVGQTVEGLAVTAADDGKYTISLTEGNFADASSFLVTITAQKIPDPSTEGDEGHVTIPEKVSYTVDAREGIDLTSNASVKDADSTNIPNVTFKVAAGYTNPKANYYCPGESPKALNSTAASDGTYSINLTSDLFNSEGKITITITADKASYTLNFEANAGSDTVSNMPTTQTLQVGGSYELPTPTRAGYAFKGWADGSKTYNAGDKITVDMLSSTTTTFTAQWAKQINVYYSRGTAPSTGCWIPGTATVELNTDGTATFQIDNKTPSRNDNSMVFTHYTANFGNKDATYKPGQEVVIPADVTNPTFTAQWTKKYYADDGNDDKPSKPSKPTYDEYRIRATCSDGGWVSPAGSTYVREGRNLTVTFAPYKGYAIDGVYIDGVLDNRYDGSYTFRDVDENHTIYVRYVRDSGSSGGSSGGGSHWDDNTSPKTGDASAPLSMGLGVGSLALIAFLVARKMRRA